MKDDLKQSNASKVGGTGGALGGATSSDLERGFMSDSDVDIGEELPTEDMVETGEVPLQDGFVGRAKGWER